MFTYERSVPYPHGHRNCMFAQRGVRTLPRLAQPIQAQRVGGVHADDAKMLYRYLREFGGICASHTSATSMGTDWRDNDSDVEPIVEIYQGARNNYEYLDSPRAGHDPQGNRLPASLGGWEPAGFIVNAFKKGYRFGFQSSSDHNSTHISYCVAVASRRHERNLVGIEATPRLWRRRDIVLDVRSGNHILGDAFKTNAAPVLQIQRHRHEVFGRRPRSPGTAVYTFKPNQREFQHGRPKPSEGVHYLRSR